MTRFASFALILLLNACTPIATQVLHLDDPWRGTTAFTTPEREIFRSKDGDGLLTVRPVVVTGPDRRAYGVFTSVRRRDANGPRIDRMTSGDTPLIYTRDDRRLTHCIDGCQRAEVGHITLSEATFRMAATTGLPLRVWGLRGRYDGTIPAADFARVLARADAVH